MIQSHDFRNESTARYLMLLCGEKVAMDTNLDSKGWLG